MSSVVFVWVVSLFSITCGIYVPVGAYFSWLYFRQQRRAKILKKRYAIVAVVHNVFCLLAIVVGQAYPLSWSAVGVLNFQLFEVFLSFVYAVVYCLLIRVWMYFFDVKHGHCENAHDWCHLLNEQSDIEQEILHTTHNFFLKYKSTLGNYKFVCKLFALLWIISLIASLSLTQPWLHREATDKTSKSYQLIVYTMIIMSTLLILPAIVAIGVIRCKTPKFMDRLFIRTEFKYLLISLAAMVASTILINVMYAFLFDEEWKEDLAISSGWFCISTGLFVNVMVCTKWVIDKMDIDQRNSVHDSGSDSQLLKLSNVFIDAPLFYKFLYHLRHEFSSELLLAYYEISYFKQWILLSENSTMVPNLMQSFVVHRFADSLPKPNKVYSADEPTHDQLKEAARHIFVKYIETGCNKEINISFHCRESYYALMGDAESWNNRTTDQLSLSDLYTLYDKVLYELYSLLLHSFYRFKQYQ